MDSWDRFREDLVRKHAPGKSFADIGCLYGAHGKMSFLAEEVGASQVTSFDGSPETDEFLAELRRRSSAVRFVRGDLHSDESMAEVGVHDIVWCTGVLYHSPNPALALQRLRSITGELLVLGSLTLPEVPGLPQACVFYPFLSNSDRQPYRHIWGDRAIGLSSPFDPAIGPYPNCWFGLTPSALVALVRASGFEVLETVAPYPFDTHVLARPTA